MSETFTQIPGSYNVPGAYTEIQFVPPTPIFAMPVRALFIGVQQGLAAASALTQNVTSTQIAQTTGIGSSLAAAVSAFEAQCPGIPMDVLALAPGVGAVATVLSLTFSGPATGSGTYAVYVGGYRVSFGVSAGDTAAEIASAFALAYGTGGASAALVQSGMAVTGTNGAVVTLTSIEASQYANDIDVRVSPYAADAVAGVTLAIASTTTGVGAPAVSAALGTIATTWYTDIVTLVYDNANLATLALEAARRYSAMVKLDTRVYAAVRGTYAQLLAITAQLNSPFLQLLGAQNPLWTPAAAVGAFAGACAQSLNVDPSLQMKTVVLTPLSGMAPQGTDLFIPDQRTVLLGSGVSTFDVATDGTVSLERVVTTYQVNASGISIVTPQDVIVPAIASRVRYEWNSYRDTTWPRAKLVDDGSPLEGAANVVTPTTLTSSWVAQCKIYEALGWIQDVDTLGQSASFTIDPTDANRTNSVLPIKTAGAWIIDANLLQVQG